MNNLEKDFPQIKFCVDKNMNAEEQLQNDINHSNSKCIQKTVKQLEDCAICQE